MTATTLTSPVKNSLYSLFSDHICSLEACLFPGIMDVHLEEAGLGREAGTENSLRILKRCKEETRQLGCRERPHDKHCHLLHCQLNNTQSGLAFSKGYWKGLTAVLARGNWSLSKEMLPRVHRTKSKLIFGIKIRAGLWPVATGVSRDFCPFHFGVGKMVSMKWECALAPHPAHLESSRGMGNSMVASVAAFANVDGARTRRCQKWPEPIHSYELSDLIFLQIWDFWISLWTPDFYRTSHHTWVHAHMNHLFHLSREKTLWSGGCCSLEFSFQAYA